MIEPPWRRRFRAARMTLPAWAPDESEHLVYFSNAGGKWELYAWDRRTGTHRQVTDRPEGTSPYYFGLDPEGRTIWWFDDHRGSEFGHWIVEPFHEAGGNGPRGRTASDEIPDSYSVGLSLGHDFALIGTSRDDGTRVHLLETADGADGPPALLYKHQEEAEVAGLSRDETLWCLQHSEHGDSRHPALRVLSKEGEPIADLWDGEGLGLYAGAWSRVPGDQRLIVLHERRDLPRPMLWLPETGETIDLDVDLPGEVDASWYPDGSALLTQHDHRGLAELFRLDLTSGALESLGVEPGTVTAARVRPDGEVWYQWSRASTPAEIRSQLATGPVAGPRTVVQPPGEPAPRGIDYTGYDIDGIHGLVAEPAAGARPYPTIFIVHGGPTSHDRDMFSPLTQAWADHGFAVVLVNYRGSTGYGKAWRDGLEGNPGLTELEDIGKVRDWVVGQGIADPDRLVLSGGSWGGYLTLLGLGTQPDKWSLGLAGVPVADYIAAYEDEMDPLKAFDRALFGGTPEEIPGFYRERSPITFIKRVRVPVLILAGENDPRCPIRQIDNYIRRLEELGMPHEVYRYEAGHGSLVIDESIRQLEIQIEFTARHLGTAKPQE